MIIVWQSQAKRMAIITMSMIGNETAKVAIPNRIAIAKNVQAKQLFMIYAINTDCEKDSWVSSDLIPWFQQAAGVSLLIR
jgi:hypothetical protein